VHSSQHIKKICEAPAQSRGAARFSRVATNVNSAFAYTLRFYAILAIVVTGIAAMWYDADLDWGAVPPDYENVQSPTEPMGQATLPPWAADPCSEASL
jgi:hypothetical protein